ncbi:hypothetical protein ABPG74_019263, partial [Tetrahymena malaccensis]
SLFISVDYDYSFQYQDILQKSDSVLNLLSFYLDAILCISSCFFDFYSLSALSLVINILKLTFILRTHAFVNKNICRWSIIIIFFKINLTIVLLLYSHGLQKQTISFILIIVLIPFCYKLGNIVFLEWYTFINLNYVDEDVASFSQSIFQIFFGQINKKIDLFCRQLIDSRREHIKFLTNSKSSLVIFAQQVPFLGMFFDEEKDSQIRQMTQVLYTNQDAQLSDQFKQDDTNGIKAIQNIYQKTIKERQEKDVLDEIDFSYLTFLAALNNNQCAAYQYIFNAKTNKKLALGIKDQQKLQNLLNMIDIQYASQKRRCSHNKSEFQLYKILQFEEDLKNIQLLYCECLCIYKIIIEKLLLSIIEINEMFALLKEFRDKRNQLENKILQQLKHNYNSEDLKNICINFDFYLLHKQTLLSFYERQNRQQFQKQQNKDFYSESSCFLFVSLLDLSFGVVKRVNISLLKALGFSNKQQIQGKSICQVFSTMNQNFDQLSSCIINEVISPKYNHIQNLPLFLAKHQQEYCVPFQLKIQSQIVDNQDFGLTIWAKEVKEEHFYLVLDQLNPNQIKLANKLFYQQFLLQNIDATQIKNLKTENLIPIIHHLIKYTQTHKDQPFQTILIEPNQDSYYQKFDLGDANFLNNLKYSNIYSATVSLQLQNDLKFLQPDIYLIISNIQPLINLNDKNNFILFYQQQIKQICNINLDFDNQYASKQNVTNSQLNQQKCNENTMINQILVQFEKNLSTLQEQSTSTHSINTNQNSTIKSAGNVQKIITQNEHQKQKKDIKPTHISPVQNQEQIPQMSPDNRQIQQTNLLLEDSIDLNLGYHSESKIYKKEIIQKCINLASPSRNLNGNNINQFNFFHEAATNEINQDNQQFQMLNYNQDHFSYQFTKQINEIPPLSSKRGLIQPPKCPIKIQLKQSNQNNHQNIKHKKHLAQKQSKIQQNIDIQSISSSSRSFQIKQVFENINKRKQMRYLKIINILGISSILVTLALTLIGFFTLLTSLVSQRENFKYINWIYLINVQISYSLSEHNIFLLNQNGFYQTPPSESQLFTDLLAQQQNSRIRFSKDYMNLLYNNTRSDIEVFKIIQNIQIVQNIYQSNTSYQQQNISMIYSILMQIFGIYYFVSNQDPYGIIKRQNEVNYPALNEQVQSVFSQINKQYQSQLQYIQSESLVQLCVIIFVTFIFLVSIIPSYIFAKKKIQQILELFATFERQQLKEISDHLANQLQFYTVDNKFHFQNIGFKPLNNQKQIPHHAISEKKLAISQTSSLEYSLKKLLIGLVVIFCLSIIYPIFNYLSVRLFIDSSTTINNFNNAVCISYFAVLNSLRARQGLAMAFLMPSQEPFAAQDFQNILDQLTIQINGLPNQIQKNIESISSTNLHNKDIFNDYLLQLFTQNSCDTIKKYPEYQNGDFSYEQCNTVGRGSLQSGLLNGLMFFFNIYKDFLSFAFSSNSSETFLQNFINYNLNFPAYKQFQFKIELSKEFEYLLNFFQDQNLQLYNYYEGLSIILVAVQVCFVVIIFTLGNVVFLEWYIYINLDYTNEKVETIYQTVFQYLLGQTTKKIDIFCRQLMETTRQKIKLPTDFQNPQIIFAQEVPFQGNTLDQEKINQVKQMMMMQKILAKQEAQLDEQFKQDDANYQKYIKAITLIYQEAIRGKQKKEVLEEIDFSYLTFLATINDNQCTAYLTILNTKKHRKLALGIKDQQKLQNIMNIAQIQNLIYKKRSISKKDDFQLYNILQLEQDLKNIQKYYCECLSLYRIIIEKLLLNFIEINEMLALLKKFTCQRSKLETNIMQQLKCNHNSENLRNICINFDFYLLHKQTLLNYYERLNRQLNQKQQNKEYYDESSSFLFVSLLDESFGVIKKVNNSFIKTLGFSNKQQIQEKSIFELQILPHANYDQQQIQFSILNEAISPIYNQIQNVPLFLAKHEAGYCVPFQLKVQTQIVDFEDFGFAIWARPIKGESIYLLLDDENPNNIKLANKLFYKQFLFQNLDTSQLKTIQIDSLIPIIHQFIKFSKDQKNKSFQTVFIQPNQDFLKEKSLLSDEHFLNNLKYADIFSITLSLYFMREFSEFISDIYLIIENVQPQNNFKDKINLLVFYQQQIKEICNIDLALDIDQEFNNNMTSMFVNQQENEESLQFRSSIQLAKNISIQNEQSTLTQILNSATTNLNSTYKSNGQALKQNNSEIKRVKKNKVTTFTNNSQRQNFEYKLTSPVVSQLQQLNLQLDESVDLNTKLQNQAQLSQNQEFLPCQNVKAQKSPEKKQFAKYFNQLSNELDHLNFSQDNEAHLEYVQTNRQAFQDNLISQNSKQIAEYPPLSSKRGLIQTVASPQNKFQKEVHMQKVGEKKNKDKKYSNQTFLVLEANKFQQNIDIQSISSSSKSVQGRYVFENIHKKKQMRYLKIINAFGILSILSILSLTLLGFFTFLTSLVSQRENFKYINWIYMINVQISYSLSERNIILLNKNNLLSTPAAQYQPFMDLLNEQNQSRIKLSKEHMNLIYNNTNKNIEVFNIIQNKNIIQNIYQSKHISQQQNLSMIYSILLQIFGIFYFVSNKDPQGIIKQQNEINYPALNEQVQTVFSQMNDEYKNQLSSIENQSLIQLFVITLIMLIFLISIIPSYIFSKKKQQQILELFATFDRLQLKEILNQLDSQLQFYQIDQKLNFSKYENQISNFQNQNNKTKSEKKLNISQTSTLKYSLKNLILILLLIFCLTTIYPIYNYFVVKTFIDNSTVIYNFNNVVCVSYFAVLNSLRARQGLAMAFLIPQLQSIPIQTYQEILNQLSVQINELPNLIKENVEKISSKNLHNQEIFDDFLTNVFTGNACDTIQKYNQYQNGDFLYDQCNTVGKGSLKSGLLNGVIFFFSIFKDYFSFAFSPNAMMLIQLQIDNTIYDKLASDKRIFSQYIGYLFFLKEITNNSASYIELAVQLFTVLNLILLISLVFAAFFKSRIKKEHFYFFSYIFQSYQYLVTMPSFYLSLPQQQQFLSLLNMLLTITMGSLLVSLDYDYSFSDEDILQKKDSQLNFIELLFDLLICICSYFFSIYLLIYTSFIINLLKLFIILKIHIHLNKMLCKLQLQLAIFRFLMPISLIAYQLMNQNSDFLFLAWIILLPLSFKIGNLIFMEWYNYINLEFTSTSDQVVSFNLFRVIMNDKSQLIDTFCRQVIHDAKERKQITGQQSTTAFFSQLNYSEENETKIFEQNEEIKQKTNFNSFQKVKYFLLFQNQIIKNIQKFQQNKKQLDKNSTDQEDEVYKKQNLQQALNITMIKKLADIYNNAIDSKESKENIDILNLSYLTLLATMYQNPCLSYLQILNIKQNKNIKLKLKDEQKIMTILKIVDQNSKFNRSIIKKESNTFQINKVLEFEIQIKKINLKYFECLKLYQEVVRKLSLNYIDIDEAFQLMKLYREQRNHLKDLIVRQLKQNSHNEILQNFCCKFDQHLLHRKQLSLYSQNIYEQQINIQKYKQFYNKQSCLAFISLLNNQFGIIQNVNKCFLKTLGFQDKQQVIGKSIQQLFPLNLIDSKNQTNLNSIIAEDYLFLYNDILDIPLFIARNNLGFPQPFKVKIQSQKINTDDFGLTIWANPIQDENIYVVLDYDDPSSVKLISKIFKDKFINEKFEVSNLKNIKMDNFIPIISSLIKNSDQNKKLETLLIRSQLRTDINAKHRLRDPNFLNSLKYLDIYSIVVKFQIVKTKIASFVYMIIENYSQKQHFKDKIFLIQQYQKQIQEICGINLEFNPTNEENEEDKYVKFTNNEFKQDQIYEESNILITPKLDDQSLFQNIINPINYQTIQRYCEDSAVNDFQITPTNGSFIDQQKYSEIDPTNEQMIYTQFSQVQYQVQNSNIHKNSINNYNNMETSQGINHYLKTDENFDIKRAENEKMKNEIAQFRFRHQKKLQAQYFQKIQSNLSQQQQQQYEKTNFKLDNNIQNSQTQNCKNFQKIEDQMIQGLNSNEFSFENLQQNQDYFVKQNLAINENESTTEKKNKTQFAKQQNLAQNGQKIESVSSSSKGFEDKQLIELINQKIQLKFLKFVKLLAFLSLISILSITVYGFYIFIYGLRFQRENFKYINWVYMINVQFSYSLSERNNYLLNENNLLQTPPSQYQEFIQLQIDDQNSRINLSKQYLLSLYNNTNPNIQLFNIVQNQYILQKFFYNRQHSDKYQMPMLYGMLMQAYGIVYFVSNLDPNGLIKQQNGENYGAVNGQVQQIFSQINNKYLDQLNQIRDQNNLQLYATILVTFFCLISLVPSYILTKTQQQKILELFATLDREQLKHILTDLSYQLQFCKQNRGNSNFDKSNSSYSTLDDAKIQKLNQRSVPIFIEKKLNISRTSSLKYSLKWSIFGLLVIFCLICIYPIINYILVSQFIDNSTIIFNFNSAVCQTSFQIYNSLRNRQGLATAFLLPFWQTIPISTFQNNLNQTTDQILSLPTLIKQNLENLSNRNLYNQHIFDDFLENIYTNNACDTISNYTQYQNGDFQYSQCSSVGQGSLKKGLLNGIVFFISIYKDFLSFAFAQNASNFQKGFDMYNQNVPAYDQLILKIELQKAHESLMRFFQDQNLQLYNYYENITIISASIQICFVTLLFIISWYSYFQNVNKIIFSTKQLLDIFPSQAILKNTYIMSFLRQNKS